MKRKAEESFEENPPKKATDHAEGGQKCPVLSREGLEEALQSAVEERQALEAQVTAADERIKFLQQLLGQNTLSEA